MDRQHGAAILARYSTENQHEDSLDVQIRHCSTWCEQHGIPVLQIFTDAATSGMKRTRAGYEAMMEFLRAGGADTVVMYDQSRAFRRMMSWYAFREECSALGVAVISVTQPQIGGDLRDPAVFLSEGVTAVFSQVWALQTRQKVVAKLRYMAERGLFTGGPPPLGYSVKDGRLEIRDDEAEIVRLIFFRYASGATYGEILRELRDTGRVTRSGRPFTANSLHDILRNRKYIGVYIYGRVATRPDGKRNSHGAPDPDMVEIPDAIPAIVSREIFDAVQRRMDENKKTQAGRPASAREYPLKGKVFCGLCKSAMQAISSTSRGGSRYYYYTCGRAKSRRDCELPHIGCGELEDHVARAILQILGDPAQLEDLLGLLRETREAVLSSAVADLKRLGARRTELTRQIEAGYRALLQTPELRGLGQRIAEMESEVAQIDARLADVHSAGSGASLSEADARELLQGVKDAAATDRAVLFSIVRRVEVYPDRILVWTILDPAPDSFDASSSEARSLPLPDPAPPAPPGPACVRKSVVSTASTTNIRTQDGSVVLFIPWAKRSARN